MRRLKVQQSVWGRGKHLTEVAVYCMRVEPDMKLWWVQEHGALRQGMRDAATWPVELQQHPQ